MSARCLYHRAFHPRFDFLVFVIVAMIGASAVGLLGFGAAIIWQGHEVVGGAIEVFGVLNLMVLCWDGV